MEQRREAEAQAETLQTSAGPFGTGFDRDSQRGQDISRPTPTRDGTVSVLHDRDPASGHDNSHGRADIESQVAIATGAAGVDRSGRRWIQPNHLLAENLSRGCQLCRRLAFHPQSHEKGCCLRLTPHSGQHVLESDSDLFRRQIPSLEQTVQDADKR
jgi:hypothetical protein